MDASTLYVIVQLANGDIRTADTIPLGSVARCQENKQGHDSLVNHYLRAGAKSVMFYCAPHSKRLVIAR